jgi:hypothetical protein
VHAIDVVDPPLDDRGCSLPIELGGVVAGVGCVEVPDGFPAAASERVHRVGGCVGQQRLFVLGELGGDLGVEVAGGVGDRVEMSGGHGTVGQRGLEPWHRLGDALAIGDGVRLLAGVPPVAAVHLFGWLAATRRGQRAGASRAPQFDGVEPGTNASDPGQRGGDVVSIERVDVGGAELANHGDDVALVHRLIPSSRGVSRSDEGGVGTNKCSMESSGWQHQFGCDRIDHARMAADRPRAGRSLSRCGGGRGRRRRGRSRVRVGARGCARRGCSSGSRRCRRRSTAREPRSGSR